MAKQYGDARIAISFAAPYILLNARRLRRGVVLGRNHRIRDFVVRVVAKPIQNRWLEEMCNQALPFVLTEQIDVITLVHNRWDTKSEGMVRHFLPTAPKPPDYTTNGQKDHGRPAALVPFHPSPQDPQPTASSRKQTPPFTMAKKAKPLEKLCGGSNASAGRRRSAGRPAKVQGRPRAASTTAASHRSARRRN